MQGLMRYWLLPMLFKRQFVRYQFGKSEQGIDLYQDYFELYSSERKQVVQYADVQTFAKGKLTYMLELKKQNCNYCAKASICTGFRSNDI